MMQKDLKSITTEEVSTSSRSRRPMTMLLAGGALAGGIVLGISAFQGLQFAAAMTEPSRFTLSLPLPSTNEEHTLQTLAQQEPLTVVVKPGNTLSSMFDELGLSQQELQKLIGDRTVRKAFRQLRPGQHISFRLNEEKQLQSLVYEMDDTHTLEVNREADADSYNVVVQEQAYEHRTRFVSGVIDSSLFLAARKAGLTDNLTMEMAAIFGWDIDFALDIREGDQFTVLYEELFRNGEKIRDGAILAAEFVNRGKSFQAIRYTDATGRSSYYTPNGLSMRKTFMRSPMDFARISSRFGKRYHPILNRMKRHNGVDYAAARGTPIRATADGKIIHIGNKGGYGKTIILKHGGRYSTLYAHMSRYARGMRSGRTVRQGQIIGYIGSSGLATGPHLHYEFRVNGVYRNPLTVRLPRAAPISAKYKDDFLVQSDNVLAQLELMKRTTQLALVDIRDTGNLN